MPTEILNYTQFYNTVARPGLVVIDAYTTWCGPCKAFAPVFERMAANYPAVTFAKVNVETVEEVATVLSISSIPTILFFKEGKIVHRVEGADPGAVEAAIQKYT